MRHLYDGLGLVEQLWLRTIATQEIIAPVRERAWEELTGWSGHRGCRTALAALVTPLFANASPLYERSVSFVTEAWPTNPLLRAVALYHLACSSAAELAVLRQQLEQEAAIYLQRDEVELIRSDENSENRWSSIIRALTAVETVHWNEAPPLNRPELFDTIRRVQENPSAEQSVRRLAETVTHTRRFGPAFARRLAQAAVIHYDSGNQEADERLTAALTGRLSEPDDGGLTHGLFTQLTHDGDNHGWVPELPWSGESRSHFTGPYRLAEVVAAQPLTEAPWPLICRHDFREERRGCYWLTILIPKVLSGCPVSVERTEFIARCYAVLQRADSYNIPDKYSKHRLFEHIDLDRMERTGDVAEAVRVVLAYDQHQEFHHQRDELAAQVARYSDTKAEAMTVVRPAIGQQHVPIVWLFEAMVDQPLAECQRLIGLWLTFANRLGESIEKVEHCYQLVKLCVTHGVTTGSGFSDLQGVLAHSVPNYYEVLEAAGFTPTAETIATYQIRSMPKDRAIPVPDSWLAAYLAHPTYCLKVGLPSLHRKVEEVLRLDRDPTDYLDTVWERYHEVLQPRLVEAVTWAWSNSVPLRDWLIDRADALEIWPQLTALAETDWADLTYSQWQGWLYDRHQRAVVEHLERSVMIERYYVALNQEIKDRAAKSFDCRLNSDQIAWLFGPPEYWPSLLHWLQQHLDQLDPTGVIELIEKLSLLELPQNTKKLRRWLQLLQEATPELARAAFALTDR